MKLGNLESDKCKKCGKLRSNHLWTIAGDACDDMTKFKGKRFYSSRVAKRFNRTFWVHRLPTLPIELEHFVVYGTLPNRYYIHIGMPGNMKFKEQVSYYMLKKKYINGSTFLKAV